MFEEHVKGKNLRIMINNVGVLNYKFFFETPPEEIEQTIIINVFTQTFITKYSLQTMKLNQ